MHRTRVRVVEGVLDANDTIARANRADFDAHGMDPVMVLGLAQALGGPLPRVLVVGCEPQTVMRGDEEDVVAAISEPVRAALDEGVRLVEALLEDLTKDDPSQEERP